MEDDSKERERAETRRRRRERSVGTPEVAMTRLSLDLSRSFPLSNSGEAYNSRTHPTKEGKSNDCSQVVSYKLLCGISHLLPKRHRPGTASKMRWQDGESAYKLYADVTWNSLFRLLSGYPDGLICEGICLAGKKERKHGYRYLKLYNL